MDPREKNEKIEALMARLDEYAITHEEARKVAEEILELDPDNAVAKLALWCALSGMEDGSKTHLLHEALASSREKIKDKPDADVDEDRDMSCHCQILSTLAFMLLTDDKPEEALEYAQELVELDEADDNGRRALYLSLLQLERYEDVMNAVEGDYTHSVTGEHARAIATIELGEKPLKIRKAVLRAIARSPEVPFLIMGIQPRPEENEPMGLAYEEAVMDACFLESAWSCSKKRAQKLSWTASVFGMLTGRLPLKQTVKTMQRCEELGLDRLVQKSLTKIAAMVKAEEAPEEIDAVAIGKTGAILLKLDDPKEFLRNRLEGPDEWDEEDDPAGDEK